MFVIKFSLIVFLLHLSLGSCLTNETVNEVNQTQPNSDFGNSTVNKFLLECLRNPTVPCVRKHGMILMNKLLKIEDLKLSDRIFLKKKKINVDKENVSSSYSETEQQLFRGESCIEEFDPIPLWP